MKYVCNLSRVRKFCHWFCNHTYFSNFILVCIMVSSALLAAEDPLKTDSDRNNVNNKYFHTKYCYVYSCYKLLLSFS